MSARTNLLCAIGAVAIAPAAEAAVFETELGSGALDEGVQVEDNSQPFFMNAQGNDGDGFEEFYVMRFDTSGYSGAPVASVEIDLIHSESFFAETGGVSLTYSADDATDLTTLTFDQSTTGGLGSQLSPSSLVAEFDFIAGNDGQVDTISLSDAGGFFADIENQGVVTLALQASDDFTAATYTGIGANDGGPVLRVTEVPSPSALGLFGLAGVGAMRRRR